MHYKKITTLAAVFAALNMSAETKPDVSVWPERYHAHKTHEFNVQMAIDAVNGKNDDGTQWVGDWNDPNQKKYFIWWDVINKQERASGLGLALFDVYFDLSISSVGPRLVFRSEAHARHFAEYFLPLMESYYLGD